MSWVGIGGTAFTSGLSLLKAGKQKREAAKLAAENPRPTAEVPEGVKKAQAIAETMSSQGIPDAQKEQVKQQIDRGAKGAISDATDRRGGLSAVSAIQQNTDDANLKLGAEDAASRVANIRNLQSQSNMLGQWQDKVWDYNSKQKYEENAAAIRALNTAGEENQNNALDGLASGVSLAATNPKIGGSIKGLFAKKGAGAGSLGGGIGALLGNADLSAMGKVGLSAMGQ